MVGVKMKAKSRKRAVTNEELHLLFQEPLCYNNLFSIFFTFFVADPLLRLSSA
jgi:hypothetical protein